MIEYNKSNDEVTVMTAFIPINHWSRHAWSLSKRTVQFLGLFSWHWFPSVIKFDLETLNGGIYLSNVHHKSFIIELRYNSKLYSPYSSVGSWTSDFCQQLQNNFSSNIPLIKPQFSAPQLATDKVVCPFQAQWKIITELERKRRVTYSVSLKKIFF